ncbi:hypothetical protein Pan189_18370 [Stratiformator vulcanicus]|uniref:Uncharacterized protein n=1 Tax=Stratiformator vulcanicus TaxID=2527980 RepID=A0A517R0N5_9PLAN|nr:hypothetical protein Pan189_18370 [Stratiformator vulcanicus]
MVDQPAILSTAGASGLYDRRIEKTLSRSLAPEMTGSEARS